MIKSSTAQTEIPPGALITFLQKGLEYIAIEEHINEVGNLCMPAGPQLQQLYLERLHINKHKHVFFLSLIIIHTLNLHFV